MKQPIRRSRMLGWDRNPLRRRIDRVEAGMVAGLIFLFLITAPVLVAVAGHWTRYAGQETSGQPALLAHNVMPEWPTPPEPMSAPTGQQPS